MLSIQLNKKALASCSIFIIVIIKDVLVSYFKIIPERGVTNRLVSWFFILPLIIIGGVLSLQVIRENYLQNKNRGEALFNINFIFSLPALIYFLYFFGIIIYVFAL